MLLDIHPEDIHPEENLQRKIMNVLDELQIMTHIKKQQQRVLKDFIAFLKEGELDARDVEARKWTLANAQTQYTGLQDHIEEINGLRDNAEHASRAVSI